MGRYKWRWTSDLQRARLTNRLIGIHAIAGGNWTWRATVFSGADGRYTASGLGSEAHAVVVDRGGAAKFSPQNVGSDDDPGYHDHQSDDRPSDNHQSDDRPCHRNHVAPTDLRGWLQGNTGDAARRLDHGVA